MSDVIKQKRDFNEKCFAEKHVYENEIYFNSVISVPQNAYVLCDVNGNLKRIFKSDQIINPPERHMFRADKKLDPRQIVIYFIAKNGYGIGSLNGHTDNKNKDIPELQYETVYYSFEYKFSVENPNAFVGKFEFSNGVLAETTVVDSINKYLRVKVSEACSKGVDRYGLEGLSSNTNTIIANILDSVEESLLDNLGVRIHVTDLKFDEHSGVKQIKEEAQLRKFIRNNNGGN